MKMHRRYIQSSVIVAVVWVIILIVGSIVDRHAFSGTVFDLLLIAFGGFVVGWVLATIACARGN